MGVIGRVGRVDRRYVGAFAAAGLGLAAVVWTVVVAAGTPAVVFLVAAGAAPVAVLLVVWARLDRPLRLRAAVGGAIVGPIVAIVGHAVVTAFAAAFFLGFLDSGRALLDELRVDPRIADVLASPWLLLLLVHYSVAAPVIEELGKALVARIDARGDAFLAGVAAGVGFAVVENLLYASVAALFGGPWPAIVVARSLGACVHPLASGMVMLGWWDARNGGGARRLARGFLSGAGVHAIWNAAAVALFVLVESSNAPLGGAGAALAFTAVLGAMFAAWLWTVVRAVAGDADPLSAIRPADARAVAAWIVLTAATLVPVAFAILAFPSFYGG
jgi:RsiW-degrading membrane proteinase PrsW (M82 family)